MAEGSSELNEKAEQANNESMALTGTGDLSDDKYLESRTDENAFNENEADENEETSVETEEIRSQIEDTRQQMSETIDAIQEKLSFSNISEQVRDEVTEKISDAFQTAKKGVYDAAIRRIGDVMGFVNKGFNEVADTKLVGAARENPLAITLIGLGIGMLLVNSYRAGRRSPAETEIGNARRRSLTSGKSGASALKAAQNKISGAASSAYETVGSAASGALESVSGAANAAYGGVTNAASQAYGKVGEYGVQAREQYDYYIEENPLAVGAVALALGAAVGLSIPSTRYETELMGEHRDNLLQKAQESAGELVDKVKQVASEAQKTIAEEVKTQTSGQ